MDTRILGQSSPLERKCFRQAARRERPSTWRHDVIRINREILLFIDGRLTVAVPLPNSSIRTRDRGVLKFTALET